MEKKILYAASTRSHLVHFHLPYLQALTREGWTVHAAFGGPGEDVPWTQRSIRLPLEKKMIAPANFRCARMVRDLVAAQDYDAVIVHTSLAAFFLRLGLLGLKKRPVAINMVHGYLFDRNSNPLKKQLLLAAERLTAPVTDLLLTMNAEDFDIARRHRLGRQVLAVPGVGVDFSRLDTAFDPAALRRSLGIPEDAFVLLYPAEFSKRKSQQVLLRALTALPANFVLVLPGTGARLDACKSLACDLGIRGQVLFPGYVDNMAPWYAMADLAVSTSRSEGLPFNVMEAMHCTLPVVASDVKGHRDLIQDEETGLLYPYGDWQACAQQILRLARNPELSGTLARQAHKAVQQFALEQVFPQVMDTYHRALSSMPEASLPSP